MRDSLSRSVQDIATVEFPLLDNGDSWINVYETPATVPFTIARVFNVYAKKPCERGKHAHVRCTQLIVCIAGAVKLKIKDGEGERYIELSSGAKGALVPSGLWVEVEYTKEDSAIMVLCDFGYDESEYIRSWDDFLRHKGIK